MPRRTAYSQTQLRNKINKYFQDARVNRKSIAVTYLASYLGVTLPTIYNWRKSKQFAPIIEPALQRIYVYLDEMHSRALTKEFLANFWGENKEEE